MERRYNLLLAISAMFAIVLISGCIFQTNPPAQLKACNWVFKTKADYSNLVSVLVNQDKTQVTAYPFFGAIKKLNEDYYFSIYGCSYSDKMGVAFTSITQDEWNQSQHACDQQMNDRDIQVRIQKCGSLDFDIYEVCRTDPNSTERVCVETVPSMNVSSPTKCTYDITPADANWNASCEPTLSSKDFLNHVISYRPFTELYLCNMSSDQLNSTIDNGELSTKCEKKI